MHLIVIIVMVKYIGTWMYIIIFWIDSLIEHACLPLCMLVFMLALLLLFHCWHFSVVYFLLFCLPTIFVHQYRKKSDSVKYTHCIDPLCLYPPGQDSRLAVLIGWMLSSSISGGALKVLLCQRVVKCLCFSLANMWQCQFWQPFQKVHLTSSKILNLGESIEGFGKPNSLSNL